MKHTPFFLPDRILVGLLVSLVFILATHIGIGSHGHLVGHVLLVGFLAGLIVRVATRRFFD